MDCLPCILQKQGFSKVTYIPVQKRGDELLNNWQRWDSNPRHRNDLFTKTSYFEKIRTPTIH